MMRLRLALRRLSRAPLFAAAVIAMLAMTLAAITMVMSVIYAAKLRPLPMQNPASLIAIWQNDDTRSATPLQDVVPGDVLAAWRDGQTSFSELTAFYGKRVRTADKQVRTLEATVVDGHYFHTLQLQPAIGRGIVQSDDADGAPPVAVLSDAKWRNDFQADPRVIGTIWRIDGEAYTIVGVLPSAANVFGTPAWLSAPGRAAWPKEASYNVIGRLAPGRSVERASAELSTLLPKTIAPPTDAPRTGVLLIPLEQSLRGLSGTAVLFIAGILLLALVAMANIGTLFLVRVLTSLRQTAISTAIGATAGRLRGDAALEGALLGTVAGAFALGGAAWLRVALQSFISTTVTASSELLPLPWPVILLTVGASILVGVIVATGAHATTRRLNIAAYLHGAGAGGTRQQSRWRLVLVGVQVAVALLACVAAARLLSSARYVSHIDVGFETDHLLVGQLAIWSSPLGTDDGAQQFVDRVGPAIANTPGLGDPAIWATIIFHLPRGPDDKAIVIEGNNENYSLHCRWATCPSGVHPVSDNAFSVLGIPLRRGRVFGPSDRGGPPVAIVNEQAQHAWFGDADPIGRRIQIRGSDGIDEWRTIVGVVANSGQLNNMGRTPAMTDQRAKQPLIFEPLAQAHLHQAGLLASYPLFVAVRPHQPIATATGSMRSSLALLTPDIESPTVSTMTAVFENGFGQTRIRLYTAVISVVASITLLLTIVGIAGAVTESARNRTRELGIRLALGSSRTGIVSTVCRGAARLLAIGVAAGVTLSVTMQSTMAKIAYGGAPAARPRGVLLMGPDVTVETLVVASAAIVLVGLVAAMLPAIRASRLDPMTVLRSDAG